MTNYYLIFMQKMKKMGDRHFRGKDKAKPTNVPLTGNRIQTRQSRSERMSQEKEEEMPYQCKRTKR